MPFFYGKQPIHHSACGLARRPPVKSVRLPELDLLRFFAALAVVLFHYAFRGHAADGLTEMHVPALEPVARYGFLGVHLFFMISGFVILMTAGDASFRKFVASRASRLLPAFWVCCTLSFAATLAFGGGRFTASWPQYLVNLLMLGGGFGQQPIDGAYWSLGTELRFYRLVAIVLLFRQIHRAERWLYVWLALTVLVELVPAIKLKGFLITDYAGFFIGGAACYLIRLHGLSPARIALVAAAWALSLHHEAQLVAEFDENFPAAPIGLPVVATAMSAFYLAMLALALRTRPIVAHPAWVWLGAISYPLYLLHQNLGYMAFNLAGGALDRDLLFWGVIAAAIALALAVHLAVERPFARRIKAALLRALDAGHGALRLMHQKNR